MEYYNAGEFTRKDKLIYSLKSNLKFYIIVGLLFVCFLVYVAVKNNFGSSQLLGFVVCLSTVWGMTLSVLLLGNVSMMLCDGSPMLLMLSRH